MAVWIYAIASVVLVSVVSLMGILTLSLSGDRLKKILLFLVGFAVGALFGDVFIHLLPESFEKLGAGLATSLYVIMGFLIFFVLEKFIRWRHYNLHRSGEHIHPVVAMNIIGDGVHNLIDGMLIAASYMVSIPIGITTTVAILLHEIPQEIGDFGILVHGGLSVKKALLFNLLTGLFSILGAVISLVIGQHIDGYTISLLPITAGGFLYIAGPDLIPELQQEIRVSTSIWQFISIILGVAIMALLVVLE
jgi:zinc and cadmium transporter